MIIDEKERACAEVEDDAKASMSVVVTTAAFVVGLILGYAVYGFTRPAAPADCHWAPPALVCP
jgi:hypothetical protein